MDSSHLISFCKFSTLPGLGRPSPVRHRENLSYTFVTGAKKDETPDDCAGAGFRSKEPSFVDEELAIDGERERWRRREKGEVVSKKKKKS